MVDSRDRQWCARLALIGLTAAVATSSVTGQAPQTPVFKTGVRLVDVDVLATDQRGNFVKDLRPEEITILEDGQPQRIQNFTLVDVPIESTSDDASKEPTPDVSSNRFAGRMFVLVLDNFTFGPEVRARQRELAQRFINDVVGPHDQVSIVVDAARVEIWGHGFTSNRQRMLAALDERKPETGRGTNPVKASFNAMEAICNELGRVSNRRKMIVWLDPPSVFIPPSTPSGVDAAIAQRSALRAAARNNVALYVVSSRGLTTDLGLGVLESNAGLRLLAEETGGDAIVSSNNFSDGFARFSRDNQSYYLLTYEPGTEYRDGKYHNVTVKVSRPGITVRARSGYYAPEPDAPDPSVADTAAAHTGVAEALKLPMSNGELAIDAFAVPFKGADGHASVLLGAELRGADLRLEPGATLEIASQLFKPDRSEGPAKLAALDLHFTEESRTSIARTGLRFLDRLEVSSGSHQIRLAVHQPNGKTGAVVIDVDVPDYRAPLVLSGVLLAAQPADDTRDLQNDSSLREVLGAAPTTRRQFTTRDVLTAFAEAYSDASRTGDVQVSAILAPVRKGAGRAETVSAVPREVGRTGYVARVTLQDVEPGAYTLTFAAKGKTVTVRQSVSFTVVK